MKYTKILLIESILFYLKRFFFIKNFFFFFISQALLDFYAGLYKEIAGCSSCHYMSVFIENYDKKRNIVRKEFKRKLKIPQKYSLMSFLYW